MHVMGGYPPPQAANLRTFHRCNVFPSYPLSFHAFAHSFALFCTRAKINPFLFSRFRTLCAKHPGWGGLLLTSCPSSHRTASAQTCSVCLRVNLSDSANSALSARSALIPSLYPEQSLGDEGSRCHLGRTSVLTSLLPYVLPSLLRYIVASSSERKQQRLGSPATRHR